MNFDRYEPLKLSELIQVDFPEDQYYREQTDKTQIVIHHTVSGKYANGVINWWKTDKKRISTHFIIQGNGDIYQLYSSKYWAHHLGLTSKFIQSLGFKDYGKRNEILNRGSIGIEICNWGGLMKNGQTYHPVKWDTDLKKYIPNTKITIPKNKVQIYEKPYRGFQYFEKYTNEQLISTARMIIYLCDKFDIPKTYENDMWDVSKYAIGGKRGIYTHTSYRSDKSDCHPQPELIEMLKSLKNN
jgi:N-acetyl-anhydromuramyl-L-alanine amidase AmpD